MEFFRPMAALVTIREAPGTTAPEGSVTLPLIVPRVSCATSERDAASKAATTVTSLIGIEAFGKPESYDPKQDSIVRLQIGRLRQKLAVYYQGEGAADPVLVGLPKGAFKLTFDQAHTEVVEKPARDPRLWVMGLAIAL